MALAATCHASCRSLAAVSFFVSSQLGMGVFSPLARRVDNARNAVHIIHTIEPATGGTHFGRGLGTVRRIRKPAPQKALCAANKRPALLELDTL